MSNKRFFEMVRKILDKRIICIPEVKEILENLEKNIGRDAFDSFQDITLQYAQNFAKTDEKKAMKIKKMLMQEYKLEEEYAIMVVNILPNHIEELRTIFEKNLTAAKLSDEDLQEMIYKIQDILK
ncbi:MAG: hypothetical protein GF364_09670 [Candidatus Lokiarchaeota archaeon]|nr:hypothetical protein [Candidatus Lokiarchaeota archaeon]